MIVLDASVLIAQLDASDRHAAAARSLLLEMSASPFASSTITLGEVLVRHAREGLLEAGQAALDDLEIEELIVAQGASHRLATLRATTRLKLPDCCVLLAAEDAGADAIGTFDDRLAEAARGLGFAVAGP